MRLDENMDVFNKVIVGASHYFHIPPFFIVKDYYLVLFLEELNKVESNIIFKGGTSLSKVHQLINRFSEDIDISIPNHELSYRRRLSHQVVNVCQKLGWIITNLNQIKSHSRLVRYNIVYPSSQSDFLRVETSFLSHAIPYEKSTIATYVSNYLVKHQQEDILNHYILPSAVINTQSLVRTFIDKIFAICDYYIANRLERNSRHIYDLSFLFPKVKFDDSFYQLFVNVRAERQTLKGCYSADNNIVISDLLMEIYRKKVYQADYNQITRLTLFEYVSYKDVSQVIPKIANQLKQMSL